MKAIVLHQFGGPDQLVVKKTEIPDVKPGHVLVRTAACGVNYIDIYQRTGLYRVDLPYTPGLEGAGFVKETGDGVQGYAEGELVAWADCPGSYAEFVLVPQDRLVKVPKGIEPQKAAAVMLQGMTAHYLSNSTFKLRSDFTCLIHAAAGGVGLLLVQMAKRIGAKVIGTVSTAEKRTLALEMGADHVILYTQQDFESQVKKITDGKGVNVVYDSVGKDTFFKSLNCLAPLGYMVLFGQSSGKVGPFDLTVLNTKGSLFVTRPSLFHYISDRDSLQKRAKDVLNMVQKNQLKVHIAQTFSLSEASRAHIALESRKTAGKVLLIP
ncbi:quinone oxidoreductase [candidate division KSB1 bacterium]|nr:quinone oxidoreductase [candidate division KSB1 bacterium]